MEIAIYTFCVMYSPGPVNLLAFNTALHRPPATLAGYCVGVGVAMLSVFLVLGYTGAALVRDALLPWLAGAGSAYILYLAYHLFTADTNAAKAAEPATDLRFRQGYCLQLLNPKGWVLVLPVTTLMFPAAGLSGSGILACALLISLGAVGAPACYALLGRLAGARIHHGRALVIANKVMALCLVAVAASIAYDFFIATGNGIA
ncbi:LysE family transporter [uncultured Salinisphaera sp.]|uniref:LysE family translocator n=1 Tax=uncultured Salinisphaera sp. TaxID=359372 RepID=UPI0032B259B1